MRIGASLYIFLSRFTPLQLNNPLVIDKSDFSLLLKSNDVLIFCMNFGAH